MKISDLSIKKPVALLSILIIAILIGVIGAVSLPVDLFPTMTLPMVGVSTTYPGAGPKEVEELVTQVLEEKLSSVSNLESMTSYSYANYSYISLEFTDGIDMNEVSTEVREKLDSIENFLPEDANTPKVSKADPSAMPVMRLAISSHSGMNLEDLKVLVEDKVATPLGRVEGVASISLDGYSEKQIEVILDQEKMYGYDTNINAVAQAIASQNAQIPIGNFTRGKSQLNLSIDGKLKNISDIENIPIRTSAGTIKLKDIASIKQSTKDNDSYTFVDGNPCITVAVKKQSNANTVDVISSVKDELEDIKEKHPDFKMIINKDDSKSINNSIEAVISAGLIGGLLAVLILFVFLQNTRSTMIIGVSIPISLIMTFAFMFVLDVGLNMISLMGLALGIGMLVDNAIVVLENIFRYKQQGLKSFEAAKKGVSEVGLAITASTLTSIAVFLPIVFIKGFAGQVFRDMALTVTGSLVSSLFIALTLVPMLSSRLLDTESKKKPGRFVSKVMDLWDSIFTKIEGKYSKLLSLTLKHKYKTCIIAVLLFIITISSITQIGMEFMPEIDEGLFKISITLPEGKIVDETFEVIEQIENKISDITEIESKFIMVSENEGSIDCDIGERADRKRGINEIMEEVRKYLSTIPGAEITIGSVSLASSGSGGNGKPFSIDVSGDDYEKLIKISNDFSEIIDGIDGTREVKSSLSDGGTEGIIIVDKEKASFYGLNISSIAGELRGVVSGNTPTTYRVDNEDIDITISYDTDKVNSFNGLENLPITASNGQKIPLSEIASINKKPAPSKIKRVNQTRVVTIDAALINSDLNTAKNDAKKVLDEYVLDDGYSYDFGGSVSSMMESFASLGLALIISIVLIYFIMSAQFESFFYPFIIMFSVPFALTGGILALYITNTSLSIVGIIGFIMLVGIVVNNAIVLIEYTNQLRKEGYELRDALVKAGPIRLKPILMTTLTTVLGMLPMAIGIGQGAEMQAPLARVIVGGLLFSTVVTLIIIPVNYSILEDILRRKKTKSTHK